MIWDAYRLSSAARLGSAAPSPGCSYSFGTEREAASLHFGYKPASSRNTSISASRRESGTGIGSTPAGRAVESPGACIVERKPLAKSWKGRRSEAKRSTETNGSDVQQVDTRRRPNLTP